MSRDDRLEKQINEFYERSPELADSLPMKDYLLKHENNQMAWYLLGKQYAAKGEEGKANYCFAQAGSIYEAFESKENPLLQAAVPSSFAAKGKGKWRKYLIASLLLLLAGAGAGVLIGREAAAPSKDSPSSATAASEAPPPAGSGGTSATDKPAGGKAAAAANKPQGSLAYVAGAADSVSDGPLTLGALLMKSAEPSTSLLVQSPILDGKWTDWQKSGLPLAEVQISSSKGEAEVGWFDSGWCPCGVGQGQDNAKARQQAAAWKPLQEGKLVLRSAINQYKARTGSWPKSAEQLAAAYPNNAMSGWNEEMTAWFEELSGELTKVDGKLPSSASWPKASGPEAGNGQPAGKLAALANHPLEIIVDKSNHRLAVVSGNVLLRNYEVGLGAGRTPVGQFAISEKVRDPNGSSTGPYGSRGMELSDTLYAIHGTDEPDSIGKDESKGCIRMKKEDLEELYDLVSLGTKVTITQKGLPQELRVPTERFHLKPSQNETNPDKKYEWLG